MKLLIKIVCIFVLILILQIPLLLLKGLVNERENYKDNVISEISQNFGGSQLVVTPVIELTYRTTIVNDKSNTISELERIVTILPEHVNITGDTNVELKDRRIYSVAVYSSNINIEGNFKLEEDMKDTLMNMGYNYKLVSANLNMIIQDRKGLKSIPKITFDGAEYNFKITRANIGSMLYIELPKEILTAKDRSFKINMLVNGSQSLMFLPSGMESEVHLKGNWPHPSFQGALLPETRVVTDSGFTATWLSSAFSRTVFTNMISTDESSYFYTDDQEFGVNLINIIDVYSLVDRSIKYGFLIISLTFLVVFMLEMVKKCRIHPIQYGLVGFALVMFFLLLLSLAEQIGFTGAYIVATLACTGLISFYVYFALKNVRTTAVFSLFLLVLYALLFLLLNVSDYALLIGSGFIFIILAAVMIATRKFDWYEIKG